MESGTCMRILFTSTLFALAAVACRAQPHRPRIAVGGLSAESNSLYPRKLVMAETADGRLSREEWLERVSKASTVASGVVEASKTLGLDIYPTVLASAGSLGYVENASFNAVLNKLVDQIKNASPKYDGVILIMHGAMVVEGYPSGDAEVARRVREAMGKDFPIVVTQDFHANIAQLLLDNSNAVITYKEDPHLDTKERGIQAATIMAGILNGTMKPTQALAKPPLLLNIIYHDTFHGPLKPLVDECRRLERTNPKILAASLPGGYQWADVPDMGPSVVIVTNDDPELARAEANRLGDMLWAMREELVFKVPSPAEGVRMAMNNGKFPVTLMDTGDNIGGGSAGDGTFILAELLRQKAEGWIITISDPEATKAAFAAGVNGAFDQMVGGKTDKMHGDPVRVRGRVKALHDGKYIETEVRHGGGRYNDMGLTAVVEVEGSTPDMPSILLLTSHPSSPNSLHQLISNGVYPARARILVVKGVTAPRAAYEPISARIIEVNSGGATDVNPAHFTYKNARKTLFGIEGAR